MSSLERALAIAAAAHEGQRKRGNEPFILHVIGVVSRVATPQSRIVAALHDVVEKSDWTPERLAAQGFSEEVLAAVDALTRREGESYEELVGRAAADPLAREVKRADLADNIARTRAEPESPESRARLRRYADALERLRATEAGPAGSG